MGVRVKLRKKGSIMPGIDYALDVALCHGWIDGKANAFDADFYPVSFTHRRAKSMWSQTNRDHIARLVEEGRMEPAGRPRRSGESPRRRSLGCRLPPEENCAAVVRAQLATGA